MTVRERIDLLASEVGQVRQNLAVLNAQLGQRCETHHGRIEQLEKRWRATYASLGAVGILLLEAVLRWVT